ncbi:MAG: pre-peptidase C-terminal domain-containing protein [Planctomycetia bacterium]|nr:pre-peptidase C-terminal domain-containing protein [Planctomycetia bacterium]
MFQKRFFALKTVLLLSGAYLSADAVALGADKPAPDYNQQIAPIFAKYCTGCHNSTDKEGELVLERYATLLSGGEHGAVVVPGKSDQSRLILVLTGKAKPSMPPEDNEKPTAAEIATLEAWISAGAKGPEGAEPDPTVLVTPKIKPMGEVREAVAAVAYAPDGKTLAVARFNVVELLSLPDRSLVRKLGPHRGRINAVSFSKDGSQLLSAAGEPGVFGEVRLWNAADGGLVRTFQGHQDSLYAAVLSPDGKLLATSSYDQQIKLWDAASGKELRTLSGHNDAVFDLAFRADGKILASASGDRTVKLWNVDNGERLDTFGQPLKELYAVAFSPDGKRVAAGGVDNRIRVWQISSEGKENTNPLLYSRFAHEGAVVKVVYSADGKTIVSAGEDRTVRVWDADMVTERLELERQSDWAPALAISPDGKMVAVGRLDGSLAFYDATSGQLIPTPPPPKPEVASLSIRGAQTGIASRIKFLGKSLADVTQVKTSHEKLAAKIVAIENGTQLEIEVTPAADLARGRYEIWLVNPAGESARQPLHLDDLPQALEAEPNDQLVKANSIGLPSDIWGVLGAKGDVDNFAFEARAGQKLVFEIAAASIGSKASAILTLFDAHGRLLADNNDFGTTKDPLMAFTIPADGRYVIQVSDLMLAGSTDHFYRLSVGELAVAAGVFPLSVPANRETEVEITGFNVQAGLKVKVPAAAGGEVAVPLDTKTYRMRGSLKVAVGNLPELLEVEPNNAPAQATPISVPGTVGGRIWAGKPGVTEDDYFRFESKAGQTWIVETDAARRGSPIDTVIEVLQADGRPIERLLLQAVRDSYVTFRGIDGNTRDCRLVNWEEMQLNQLVYLNGEVVKLFRSPRGPDSGFLFYEGEGGKRQCYFDTTGTVHAVDEPCFVVEPHAPGTKLVANGLPVFPLYYANDDDGQRRLGSDSRLTFTAPADGAYLIRVRDARGDGGDGFAYRLTVRSPQPDFNVSLSGANPTIEAGSGKKFSLEVDRIDGFDGEVRVDVSGLPEGFQASTPVVIQAGQRDADGVILAVADAKQPSTEALSGVKLQATATVGSKEVSKPVNNFGQIKLAPKPKLLVRLEPAELVIAPGATITAMLKVERNGHDDLVTFSVENLPHGVIVDNIGLNGVLMPNGENERQIFITADAWVPETSRLCFAVENQVGNQCSPPVTIHVRRACPLVNAAAK